MADTPPPGVPKAKVAVLVSGTGTNMAALLYASRLPDAPYEVVLVASNDPEACALKLAAAEGIATFALSHKGMERADHDAAMDAAIRRCGAEYVALAGYMRILGDAMVGKWAGRMVNIHPSLLPLYPGLKTHARAIEAGDTHGGASVHLVIPELDSGEVLGQVPVAILPEDTPDALASRVKLAEHQLYPRMLGDYVARGYDAGHLYSRVADLALALPEAEEKTSHGAPGFRTGGKSGKFFAHFSDQHHGVPHISVLAKTSGQDELTQLIERDAGTFYKPAYYGASGWVGIILNRPDCDWDQVAHWLERSWRSVAPKRLIALQDAADEF